MAQIPCTFEPRALIAFVAARLDEGGDSDRGARRAAPRRFLTSRARAPPALTAAINTFHCHYMKEVEIALARMRVGPSRTADVKQLVRQRLFVGADGVSGKIGDYGGARRSAPLGPLGRGAHVPERHAQGQARDHLDDDQLIAQHAMPGDDPRSRT